MALAAELRNSVRVIEAVRERVGADFIVGIR
jgi:2,4-dienoyl-CoA reductase-like NADH-dependent reductase (Old Yellow Enzyme family)